MHNGANNARYQQAPAYIGKITPKNSRGAFTMINQLMLTCGLSLVYFVGNVVTWRTLAIIGTIPSLAEVIGLFFIPESPRWLVLGGTAKRKKLLSPKDMDASPMIEVVKGCAYCQVHFVEMDPWVVSDGLICFLF
ncbi:Sugar transporter ERD6-like 12 [Camellia lanceoleosa]|uniref:Sugar transporter ERD6-like 12 n=1 Tax=Camellia lanceoleosa TaxID=1840588 RepID=A0ACC0HBH8_9ERIC|nr:Sugar transporter ERD6-like 12 [Camellia lanceoleosa]